MQRSIQGIMYCMKNQEERMNIIANNIANINTRAYKKEVLSTKSFEEVMLNAMNYNNALYSVPIGSISFGVEPAEYRIDFSQGNLQETGFDTDFAIRGEGFFVLDTPQGIGYTRAGNFSFDEEGFLIAQVGNEKCYVLSENGRIFSENKRIKINSKGEIEDGSKFRIVNFNDLRLLEKSFGGIYYNYDNQNIINADNAYIMQNYLEDSNVSAPEETRDMLEAKRNYESCQQIIKMIDDVLGKAVNDIARL